MQDRINDLRKKLNKLLESKLPNDEDVLKISRELDLLILEYYKNKNKDSLLDNENKS